MSGDLTKNFSLRELGDMPAKMLPRFTEGLLLVLQPIREAYGKAIRITSAYRSPQYNSMIGGSSNSQHRGFFVMRNELIARHCCAFDFEQWHDGEIGELWPVCVRLVRAREIRCDQLIHERGKIHASYVLGREPRFEIRTEKIVNGKKEWPLIA